MEELSRFLSYVLRHAPHAIGLTLDPQGFVSIDELIGESTAAGTRVDRAMLLDVVATSDKKRFTLSEDRTRIRAAQGHSVAVDLGLRQRRRLPCCITARRPASCRPSSPKA